MFIMARITSCTTLEEVDQLFTSLCISCLPQMKYPEIEPHIKKLEKAIFQSTENYEVGMDYLSEIDEELSNELGDRMTYRNQFPFEDISIPFYRKVTLLYKIYKLDSKI